MTPGVVLDRVAFARNASHRGFTCTNLASNHKEGRLRVVTLQDVKNCWRVARGPIIEGQIDDLAAGCFGSAIDRWLEDSRGLHCLRCRLRC